MYFLVNISLLTSRLGWLALILLPFGGGPFAGSPGSAHGGSHSSSHGSSPGDSRGSSHGSSYSSSPDSSHNNSLGYSPGRPAGHERAAAWERSRWIVLKSSSLNIAGHTNINRFACAIAQYTPSDTLTILPPTAKEAGAKEARKEAGEDESSGLPLSGTLKLDIDQFDCHSRMMTSEFKKTLQYRHYPQLTIRFINLEKMPDFTARPETLKGWVEIGLAGACKLFEIDYTASRSDRCSAELTGLRQLRFQDFGLVPPRKMGGMVRVNDTLNVQFTLCLRQTP